MSLCITTPCSFILTLLQKTYTYNFGKKYIQPYCGNTKMLLIQNELNTFN